ncbi:nucleotide sugar dehydrogenase [Rhodoplanes sp. Z2-YC6860]|uniref:nucleotide sugar dehydrogenase n=1 Tax=Rhodoplanes sp. Z2-YC6860 TaxID=674703 RepID=UPI00078C6049|nr:nucleotide sugar dehydrogenase [Rhodoplanes sp. Z2-YC6860]AMN42680.1 nucleotide sugar dehydrogenase [Rhodoplanes sp. Z2-YC6860]
MAHGRKIAVIGLGYVGLPVAVAFARSGVPVLGFDIDKSRIEELRAGRDRSREIEPSDLHHPTLRYESDAAALSGCDFFIVTVPTPVDAAHQPDLTAMLAASRTVGAALKRGGVVVYESTVYPGAVEEDCVPVLEQVSGLKVGKDFSIGYSPERINPGDKAHRFENIVKVVSGFDEKTLDLIADVYGSVVKAGVHRAPSIKVAEAAKVIENSQRDLNIAFMNELSAICEVLHIDTGDVLAAARTKWNFLPFVPGLVGGHCIGVDPYYLTHRAEKAGYQPQVILAGRRINDGVGKRVALECVRSLFRRGVRDATVTVLGMTFKENVPDTRNSKVADIVRELQASGVTVQVHDPLAIADETKHEYGIALTPMAALQPADAVVVAVAHEPYVRENWRLVQRLLRGGAGLVFDVRGMLDRAAKPEGIDLWRL